MFDQNSGQKRPDSLSLSALYLIAPRSSHVVQVTCMKLLRHPHVIKLYEAIDTEKHLYLIMELGDGGDL